jgi:catechol 2,3-dioxygenase
MFTTSWPLGNVTLKVLDLSAQISFYNAFGFRELTYADGGATLATLGAVCTARYKQLPASATPQQLSAGLFHFTILVPDREPLGSFFRHEARYRWNLVGSANHLVSESLYSSYPEGHGIEVYADRPRQTWQ